MLSAPNFPRQHSARHRMGAVLIAAVVLLLAAAPVRAANPDPIFLIHGYRGSASNLSELKTWLQAQGRTVVALSLPGQDNKVIAQYIKDQAAARGWKKFDLVMHSMGGLSGRYLIKSLGGTATVQGYVSLGAPQYGVYSACVLPSFYGGQMCPWNSFLTALNSGDDTPNGPAWATIYSRNDEIVPFQQSEQLSADLKLLDVPHEAHFFDGLSHYLLADQPSEELTTLYDITLTFLRHTL